MPLATDFETIVIGGGPAGSTTAALLAMKGLKVLILERELFPRSHVGESLLPASLPIFDSLGVRDAIDNAGFLKKYGAAMVWGNERSIWSWLFAETKGPYSHSYQVTRPEFDTILLDNAREKGVHVREQCQVLSPMFSKDDATITGVEFINQDGNHETLTSNLVIDASGQQTLFANQFNLKDWDVAFKHLAIYGYYTGGEHLPSPDQGSIFIESFENGWVWKIPLHDGTTSVGVVMDSDWAQAEIKKSSVDALFQQQVQLTNEISGLISNATFKDETHLIKDWSYVTTKMTGDGYALVGDAACFIDPLFSSGVHLALQSGVLAAAYAATVIQSPDLARSAARQYEATYRRRYGYFHELARLFYGSNKSLDSKFWRDRSLNEENWSDTSREEFINVVAGNAPEGYERVVIDQGHAPENFINAIEEAEINRVDRATLSQQFTNSELLTKSPKLVDGARLVKGATLGDGIYELGYLLQTPARPEGYPVIPPIALLLNTMDQKRTVGSLAEEVASTLKLDAVITEQLVLVAIRNLAADGLIEL
jgi:flavin-dependent dehydrogenase